MSIEQEKQQLAKIEQEIKALTSSQEYKNLATRNRSWAEPKATDNEKREWELLQEQLAKLQNEQELLQVKFLKLLKAQTKSQDQRRKEYKRNAAIESEWRLLCTIAEKLYQQFHFKKSDYSECAQFEDLMLATGFETVEDINNYFDSSTHEKDIRNFFTRDVWIFSVNLYHRIVPEIRSGLKPKDGKLTLVLESDCYNPEIAAAVIEQIRGDITELDIKNADSDSSQDD